MSPEAKEKGVEWLLRFAEKFGYPVAVSVALMYFFSIILMEDREQVKKSNEYIQGELAADKKEQIRVLVGVEEALKRNTQALDRNTGAFSKQAELYERLEDKL